MKRIIFIFSLFVLIACSSGNELAQNTASYIDIKSFVDGEIEELQERNVVLVKRSQWKDELKLDTLHDVKWREEMYPFVELDIKPTVWKTDFSLVDSSRTDNEMLRTFKARNDMQELRSFSIITSPETKEITRFDATIRNSNKLTDSEQTISYTKGVGYTIKGHRDTKMFGGESYQIVGQFYIQKD